MKGHQDTSNIGGTTLLSCWVHRAREIVITQADFSPLFAALSEHVQRWGPPANDESQLLLQQSLAAATLHLAALPPDEFVAWTMNLPDPPLNLFVAGDNRAFAVTGRAYSENVKTAERARLYFESQRPKREPQRSVLDVDGRDVLSIYEQFFLRSVQLPTRLFCLGDERYAFLQGLPRVERTWLQALGAPDVEILLADTALEEVEQRHYRFACSCDQQTMLKVILGMFRGKADELFLEDDRVEVSCPRCGRRWWISRDEFDEGKVGSA